MALATGYTFGRTGTTPPSVSPVSVHRLTEFSGLEQALKTRSAQGKTDLVPLAANRFLTMMAETTIGWLLLEQAVIAIEKSASAGGSDKAFYDGKRYAAQYFAQNILPNVTNLAGVINGEDVSALDVPEEALGA